MRGGNLPHEVLSTTRSHRSKRTGKPRVLHSNLDAASKDHMRATSVAMIVTTLHLMNRFRLRDKSGFSWQVISFLKTFTGDRPWENVGTERELSGGHTVNASTVRASSEVQKHDARTVLPARGIRQIELDECITMRQLTLLLAGCVLGWTYAHAHPLTGSFEGLMEHVAEHGVSSTSTTLSLGRNSDRIAPPDPLLRPHRVTTVPIPVGFPQQLYEARLFSHSPSSAFKPPTRPSRPQEVAVEGLSQQVRPTNRITPKLDLQIPSKLRSKRSGRIRLPDKSTYVPSQWLGPAYFHILQELPLLRAFHSYELPVPAEIFSYMANNRNGLHSIRGEWFKLQLPDAFVAAYGVPGPMEVLVRYHSHLKWPDKEVYSIVSFWSTAGGGSELALLGVFHMTKVALKTLVRSYPEIKRYAVVTFNKGSKLHVSLVPRKLEAGSSTPNALTS